jgi:hypothetical protein
MVSYALHFDTGLHCRGPALVSVGIRIQPLPCVVGIVSGVDPDPVFWLWISSRAKSIRIGPVDKTLTDVRICSEVLKKPEFDGHN